MALIAAGVIALSWLLSPIAAELSIWLPECQFHRWTGWACPSCGATRATLALLRGELLSAVSWNPLLAIAIAIGALYGLAAPLMILVFRRVPVVTEGLSARGFCLLAAAILTNWAYLIAYGV